MKVVEGDLIEWALQGQFDVILHGANCHHKMGSGIAKTIKMCFPEAYSADTKTLKGSREKLGQISFAKVVRGTHRFTVVNCYTQYGYGNSGVLVDYEAVRKAAREVRTRFGGQRIGYPKIGAGLGGGDWNLLSAILDEEFDGLDHTLVVLA